MKNVFRKTSLVMSLLLALIIVLAGCGTAASSSGDQAQSTAQATAQGTSQGTSQTAAAGDPIKEEIAKGPVTLVGYQFGDATVDHNLVLGELNKKLEKDINTTLDLRCIPWTDAEQKYKLLFSSGEEFDFAYAGAWIGFNQVATTNGYMPIDLGMAQKYAPDAFAVISKDRWKQTMVQGKIYGLPNINAKVKNGIPVFRGDILKKYNIPEMKNTTDFVNGLLTLAKSQKDMITWNVGNVEQNGRMRAILYGEPNNLTDIITGLPVLCISKTDTNYKIFKTYEDPKYLDYLKTTKQLADAGVWSKSALASKDADLTNWQAEKSVVYIADELNTIVNEGAKIAKINPAYTSVYYDVNPGYKKIPEGGNMSCITIHATSKHPERVMMVFNLLETKKDYFDLVTYGIAGTHYEAVGDNKYKQLPKYSDFGGFSLAWGTNNSKLIRDDASKPQDIIDLYNKYMAEDAIETPLATFIFDDSKVKNEEAACRNIIDTYLVPIELAATDQTKGLATMVEKLKAAGIDKIQTEAQTQLDAFVKDYNAQ